MLSLEPGWLRSVASVVAYLVPPTFSVTMVDGSDSGRIAPLCAGVSAAAGVPRPRRSGVAIPAQRRWPGPGQEAPPRAPLCCATVFVGLPSAGLKEGFPHWPVAGAAARWHRLPPHH